MDELKSYIAQRETTLHQVQECLTMVTFEKQEAFMAAMKAGSQMEDQNNHTMKKNTRYKKCLFKLNKRIVIINRIY